MTDYTLSAPGTTNSPWTTAPGLLAPVGTSNNLATTAAGIHAVATGNYSEFAHDANYGSIIAVSATVISGATSNGDEVWIGNVVRRGANAGCGFGIVVGAVGVTYGWWTGTPGSLGGFTAISTNTPITRANNDVFGLITTVVGGTSTATATQNGVPLTLNTTSNTNFTTEPSLAAGGALNAQNTNSLFISQFTGNGVVGARLLSMLNNQAGF